MAIEYLAIDPGSEQSAVVRMLDRSPLYHEILPNAELLRQLPQWSGLATIAIEMIASYGMAVGAEVFETCVWIGRFMQAAQSPVVRIFRNEVKLNICKSPRANDANIRQALIDRYGPTKEQAIGTKRNPGPLYGFRADEWAALAVALTWFDRATGSAA